MSFHPLKVSIIINNYNYDTFLGQAIESALNQSYPNTEVIVVDDGSEDDSVTIIQQYGDRITPVFKKNGGQASAINAGFDVSNGDLILFLDADDYLFAHAVETIVSQWQTQAGHYAQVQSRLELVDAQGGRIDLYPAPEIQFDQGDVTPLLLKKGRYNTTVTSGTGFSRIALQHILPIPEDEFRISADGYLVTTAPFYGPILAVETPIGGRRKHDSNAWAVSDDLKVEQFRKSFEHDFVRHKYLKRAAQKMGYQASSNLELFDYLHLQDRLTYLRLDSQHYPISGDSQHRLALRGIWAVLKYSQFTWSRKILLCFWFFWLGFGPQLWVTTSIRWRFLGGSRPTWIDRVLKRVRYLTS